jgi:hypothetical protein
MVYWVDERTTEATWKSLSSNVQLVFLDVQSCDARVLLKFSGPIAVTEHFELFPFLKGTEVQGFLKVCVREFPYSGFQHHLSILGVAASEVHLVSMSLFLRISWIGLRLNFKQKRPYSGFMRALPKSCNQFAAFACRLSFFKLCFGDEAPALRQVPENASGRDRMETLRAVNDCGSTAGFLIAKSQRAK